MYTIQFKEEALLPRERLQPQKNGIAPAALPCY